jgi:hypothetical protein
MREVLGGIAIIMAFAFAAIGFIIVILALANRK